MSTVGVFYNMPKAYIAIIRS